MAELPHRGWGQQVAPMLVQPHCFMTGASHAAVSAYSRPCMHGRCLRPPMLVNAGPTPDNLMRQARCLLACDDMLVFWSSRGGHHVCGRVCVARRLRLLRKPRMRVDRWSASHPTTAPGTNGVRRRSAPQETEHWSDVSRAMIVRLSRSCFALHAFTITW